MRPWIVLLLFVSLSAVGYGEKDRDKSFDDVVRKNAAKMLADGKRIFRFDTFGDEAFWSGAPKLHQAIAGEADGGVGAGARAPPPRAAPGARRGGDRGRWPRRRPRHRARRRPQGRRRGAATRPDPGG